MKRFLALALSVSISAGVQAANTGTTALHTPQASGAGTGNGDFVSDSALGALNTPYRYWIEVTPGLARLAIDIYDADWGLGGDPGDANAGRDRARGGYGDVPTVNYSLFNPAGTQRTTNFTTGNNTQPAGSDGAFTNLYDSTGETFRDNFAAAAYNNNNGTMNWAANWTETNDDANAGAGLIQITGGELRIRDDGAGGVSTIHREVNLSNTTSATLTFDFRTQNVEAGDQLRVEMSNNGGGSWTTLETFTGTFAASARTYNIDAYIATNTRVRFIEVGGYTSTDSFFVDNLQIKENTIRAGHWELRIDQSSAVTAANDINAIGIRAHDGTSGAGGTEINVYADSFFPPGVNPPATGTNSRNYTLYPYITSGCSCGHNDFDLDSNAGNIGSATYTSRLGTFSQTVASAALSGDNTWNRDEITGWVTDDTVDDYGIWTYQQTINSYVNVNGQNGNYAVIYATNYTAAASANPATAPTANPQANTFRFYLPTDAGTAPVKPYLEQFLTRKFSTSTTMVVGTPFPFSITIRITNPTPYAITFSTPTNIMTSNIPGGGTVYNGNTAVSQGTIVSQPAIGGTGNFTWNPGTIAAGADAIATYDVNITAASVGQRIAATATPGSGNGTRARFVDETGNTTQARATYTLGGICELAATQGLATEVMVASFEAGVRGGRTLIEWNTASEAGTVGFNVYRLPSQPDGRGEPVRVNARTLPANVGTPQGGRYRFVDPSNSDPSAMYLLEEITAKGTANRYGPYRAVSQADIEPPRGDYEREPRKGTPRPMLAQWMATQEANLVQETNATEKVKAAIAGVTSTGIVKIPATSLATLLGSPLPSVQNAIRKGGATVTNNGAQVAWATFGDGEAILFFGQKSDSIYSNARAYRIDLSKGTTMANVAAAPAAATTATAFASQKDAETDSFPATVLPLDPESDYWFWDYIISGDPTDGRKQFTVDVPAVASASGVVLQVRLQGVFANITHFARLRVNNVFVNDTSWSGLNAHVVELAVPAATLVDGVNTIEVEGLDQGVFDVFYVDGFTIRYSRAARPDNSRLEMKVTPGQSITAGPFAGATTVLDTTNPLRPRVLTGGSFAGGVFSMVVPAGVQTLYFMQAAQFITPTLRPSYEPQLKSGNRADYVVIAPSSIRAAAESLAQSRQRNGLTTFVADLEQIYDEFSNGNVTPHAIRQFIAATRNWSKVPKYFALAGGGTLDYRGLVDPPGLIPPLMTKTTNGLFAADSLFGDFNNDGLPDVAIGRIPVNSASELAAYVNKIDASALANVSNKNLVFAADAQDQSASFRTGSERIEVPLSSRPATRVYLDVLGASAARTTLFGAWQSGTPLVSWLGHGGLDRLSSSGVLTADDAPSLTSGGVLPVLVAMTCEINRFEIGGPFEALGSALTRTPNAGATAVWSASGLSVNALATDLEQTFMQLAAKTPGSRIGDLIVKSFALNRSIGETGNIYLLLGDPAIRLSLPNEPTPSGPTPAERE